MQPPHLPCCLYLRADRRRKPSARASPPEPNCRRTSGCPLSPATLRTNLTHSLGCVNTDSAATPAALGTRACPNARGRSAVALRAKVVLRGPNACRSSSLRYQKSSYYPTISGFPLCDLRWRPQRIRVLRAAAAGQRSAPVDCRRPVGRLRSVPFKRDRRAASAARRPMSSATTGTTACLGRAYS